MTNGNEFKLGNNSGSSVDLSKLKSGAKRKEFEADEKMLQVFDAVDANGNSTLDLDEVTLFTDKVRQSAGEDNVLSKSESKQIFAEQQERAKKAGEDSEKYEFKAKDLFGFLDKFKDVSAKSDVKSSVVDEKGNQIITYEDGAQQILNKDGSRILINVVDGKKFTKSLDKDGKPVSDEMVNDETGDVETILYDVAGKPKEHTVKNGNTTTFLGVSDNFGKGKPVKQILNEGTAEQQVVEYDYSGENSYTSTMSKGDVKNVTVVENGETQSSVATQYKNGKKVQSMSLDRDGVTVRKLYDANEKVAYESVADGKGNSTETTFNEKGRKMQSVMINADGKVQVAKYDGKGNTLVVVQNGETFEQICKEFDRTKAELAHTNKGNVHYRNGQPYFLAGETAKVSGEFDPDYKGLQGRLSSEQVRGQYASDEQVRVAKRLQGKEVKEVTVGKDYTDWFHYSKDMLKSEGVANPTNEQVTNRANELQMMNSSVQVPKKGVKLTAVKTQAEIKAEREAEAKRQQEAQRAQQLGVPQAQSGGKKVDAKLQREASNIATSLYNELRKNEFATVDKNQVFKNQLNKINVNNVLEVCKAYDKMSPDETLAKKISWELTSSNSSIRGAEGKLFNALYARANQAGISKQHIANFRRQADLAMADNDANALDKAMSTLVQAIDNRENLGVSASEVKAKGTVENRKEAIGAVEGLYAEANRALTNHGDSAGWAGKVVGGMRNLFDAPESPARIKQYMTEYNKQIQRLKDASGSSLNPLDNIEGGKNDKNFKSTFKSIYGVEYDAVAVSAYNKKRAQFRDASSKYALEQKCNADLEKLIKGDGKLVQEQRTQTMPNAGSAVVVTATKEQVYNRELKKFASFIGMGNEKVGLNQINEEMKKAGIDPKKASMDVKYKFLSDKAKTCSKMLHNQTMVATGGKSFAQVNKEYRNSYAGAFGTSNNVQQKVEDYVNSIEASAGILKSGVKIVGGTCIGIMTGGTGVVPLLTAAGAQSALTFTVDASDLATSKKGGTKEQYMNLVGTAIVDGTSQIVSGYSTTLVKNTALSATSKVLLNTAIDTTIDMGVEYINTGEVTLQNTLISAFSAGAGHTLSAVAEHRAQTKEYADAFEMDTSVLDDQNSGWLGEASDAHHRYRTELTADEAGNFATRRAYVGRGMEAQSGNTSGVTFDVRMSQHNQSVADIENLLGKGASRTEFGEGLVKLEDRFRADGGVTENVIYNAKGRPEFVRKDDVGNIISKSDANVTTFGSYARNDKVKQMGLEGRMDVLQDAGTFSAKAYSDRPADMNGWKQQSQVSAPNGFHAKALEKDGVVMIVFRGSDDMGDLKVDHQMLSGRLPDQFQNAVDFVEQVKAQNPNAKIVVTGHSLGGGLTELVASKYDDVLGISFDAVGTKNLVESSEGLAKGLKDNRNTLNYIVSGDVISNANPHVGQAVLVDNVVDATKGNKMQSPHAIGNFSGSAGNTSISGVESGFLQRQIDSANASRASLASKGLTLDSAIANSASGTVEFDDKSFRKVKSQFALDVQGLNVDLDAMQTQINAVSNPVQRDALQKVLDARKIDVTVNADIKSRSTVLQQMTGEEINDVLMKNYGFDNPAFLGGDTPSSLIKLDKPTKFVRVYNDGMPVLEGEWSSYAKGPWIMAYDDIKGLSPEQIKDKFALPSMPRYVVEVEVPAGTEMFTGKCNPLEGWGNGGGTQYFITGENRPKVYGNMKLIQP